MCVFAGAKKVFSVFSDSTVKFAETRESCDCKHDNLFEVRRARQTAWIDRGIMRHRRTCRNRDGYIYIYRLHNSPDELLETVKCISTKEKKRIIYTVTTYAHAAMYV